jgi:putative ABC transport system substrate-binding protein
MNKRRKLIVALGAGALTAPFGSFGQQPGKVWRVGFLAPRSRPASLGLDIYGAFQQGMRELGYIEGKNLVIEWRFGDNQSDRLPRLATELVRLNVDVIVASGTQAIGAAQKATDKIPIIMGNVNDPAGNGFVESLARPGRNITGLSAISSDMSPKRLEMLLGMAPTLARVAVLVDPANPAQDRALKNIQETPMAGVAIVTVQARTPREIETAFVTIVNAKAQALIFASSPIFLEQRHQLASLAVKHRLPSISGYREYAEAGLLMSYGPSITEMYRRAAAYVDKIFKGAKPSELPVEQPTKFELIINGKTAKALGLKIPQSLLISANEVIE